MKLFLPFGTLVDEVRPVYARFLDNMRDPAAQAALTTTLQNQLAQGVHLRDRELKAHDAFLGLGGRDACVVQSAAAHDVPINSVSDKAIGQCLEGPTSPPAVVQAIVRLLKTSRFVVPAILYPYAGPSLHACISEDAGFLRAHSVAAAARLFAGLFDCLHKLREGNPRASSYLVHLDIKVENMSVSLSSRSGRAKALTLLDLEYAGPLDGEGPLTFLQLWVDKDPPAGASIYWEEDLLYHVLPPQLGLFRSLRRRLRAADPAGSGVVHRSVVEAWGQEAMAARDHASDGTEEHTTVDAVVDKLLSVLTQSATARRPVSESSWRMVTGLHPVLEQGVRDTIRDWTRDMISRMAEGEPWTHTLTRFLTHLLKAWDVHSTAVALLVTALRLAATSPREDPARDPARDQVNVEYLVHTLGAAVFGSPLQHLAAAGVSRDLALHLGQHFKPIAPAPAP